MNDEIAEARLLAVFEHYELPEPRYGEHPMKCPVHGDRVASASVNRGKGVWHCHACGAGGNAESLVAAMENLEYSSARAWVDGLVGASVPRRGALQGVSGRRSKGRWVPPALRSVV